MFCFVPQMGLCESDEGTAMGFEELLSDMVGVLFKGWHSIRLA